VRKAVAIIPARFNSTRFPGKPLAVLKGKVLIQHVYEKVLTSSMIDTVIVATDDQRIFDAVITINIQGDEPFIKSEMIDDVVNLLYNDDRVSISTLARKITGLDEILSPNVVKVVTDDEGFALYFSRSPIPYYRDEWKDLDNIVFREKRTAILKHIGIYGFRKDALINFSSIKKSRLEHIEKLEQLRALSVGMKIKVKETELDTFGIDTIEDLRKAEEWQSISS
jgi:3-deoxy-manno-octulosonate cytidylyltransferase (CMP-KDO synthetase)